MARASRKTRLPISSASGVAPKWRPSKEDWGKIERAYGVEFDEAMRAEVAAIVAKYFENESFGRNAPFVDSSIEWLKGIERASLSLVEANTAAGGGGGKVYAEGLLNDHLRSMNCAADFRLRDLLEVVMNVAVAARWSINEIKSDDHPKFDEKMAWRTMVARLWSFADRHSLSAAINKSGFVETSHFVSFVRELQGSFIGVATWHTHSDASLAEEISKATREARKLKSAKN